MQIEITKHITQSELIEVELPYYYKHYLRSDYGGSTIYGKIEEQLCTSIHENIKYEIEKYEIEKEEYKSIKDSGVSSYFNEIYISNKQEFELAKQRCVLFLNNI